MLQRHFILVLIFILPSYNLFLFAQARTNKNNQNEELGKVSWYRNYDEAISQAKKENKSIVILFQEVPGCATCRNYGHNVLSHPLMAEALENLFIPLAIFNNKGGHDKKILDKYREPTWNNPVIRIINSNGENIVKRISADYSSKTLCKRLKEALIYTNKKAPKYLNLLEQELNASNSNNLKEINFKMYCFWNGEKQLGKLDGVVNVESGFIQHHEVVKVQYNESKLSKTDIIDQAKKQGFQTIDNSSQYKKSTKDVHYYLTHSYYQYIPLTELQKTKINSALGSKSAAQNYLSPQQLLWLQKVKSTNAKGYQSMANKDIRSAWKLMKS